MGSIKGWSELQLDFAQNTNKETKQYDPVSTDLTFSQTLNHSDFWFGTKIVAGVPKGNVDMCAMSLLWKNGAWDFWARGGIIRKAFGAGFTWRESSKRVHSSELIFDAKEDAKTKGIFGTPLFFRYGFGMKTQNISWDARMFCNNDSINLS